MKDRVSEGNGGSGKVRSLYESSAKEDTPAAPSFPTKPISNSRRLLRYWPYVAIFALAATLLTLGLKYHGAAVAPRVMIQKMETLAALRVSLLKSVESEKRAVMADTYELSRDYAEESRKESEAAEAERIRFAGLLKLYPVEEEGKLLQEFDEQWEKLRKLDEQILELAVQNTNLKANALSVGRGSDVLHRFQSRMEGLMQGNDDVHLVRLAAGALASLLTVQTLHAPHVASASAADMDRIEQTIHEQEGQALGCLERLAELVPPDRGRDVVQALADFSEYRELTQKVIELSRRNTNVTSLEFSLNRKMRMAAQCDAVLTRLQDVVRGRDYKKR
jgi:hypothetical protein